MWTFSVIEAFDVLENRLMGFGVDSGVAAVGFFFFQILKERFAHSIVKRIAFLEKHPIL